MSGRNVQQIDLSHTARPLAFRSRGGFGRSTQGTSPAGFSRYAATRRAQAAAQFRAGADLAEAEVRGAGAASRVLSRPGVRRRRWLTRTLPSLPISSAPPSALPRSHYARLDGSREIARCRTLRDRGWDRTGNAVTAALVSMGQFSGCTHRLYRLLHLPHRRCASEFAGIRLRYVLLFVALP